MEHIVDNLQYLIIHARGRIVKASKAAINVSTHSGNYRLDLVSQLI